MGYGTSSSGKQTFIKNVLSDRKLAEQLGWKDKSLTVCRESVDYPGDMNMPEVVRIRQNIPNYVSKLLESSDVVIIKWQYVDSYCETPQKLREMLPGVEHRLIELRASQEILIERLERKDWWRDKWGEEEKRHIDTKKWWPERWHNAHELLTLEEKMIKKFMNELVSFSKTIVICNEDGKYSISSSTNQV